MRLHSPANAAERVARTDAVLSKYRHRPFSWADRATCIHLFRAQAVAMGHQIMPMPQFRSALGAKKVLAKLGKADLVELLDGLLPGRRIAPAAMWVGDIAALPAEDGFQALLVHAGGKLLGWHGEDPSRMHAIELSRAEWSGGVLAAWRL